MTLYFTYFSNTSKIFKNFYFQFVGQSFDVKISYSHTPTIKGSVQLNWNLSKVS